MCLGSKSKEMFSKELGHSKTVNIDWKQSIGITVNPEYYALELKMHNDLPWDESRINVE